MKVYRLIHDARHGWLEVRLHDLGGLGLFDKITGCSYMSTDRQTIYLEEDYDAQLFIEAKKSASDGRDMQIWHDAVNGDSFVQELEHYNLQAA